VRLCGLAKAIIQTEERFYQHLQPLTIDGAGIQQ
jgi:hypothetical protein